MSWIKLILIESILFTLAGCNTIENDHNQSGLKHNYLIDAQSLYEIIETDSIKVLDLRKFEDYTMEHIPGSVNIWRTEVQNDSFPYNGMLPTRMQLEYLLSSKGIQPNDFLILYDDHSSCEAARMWWVLQYFGYSKLAILDGGINAWREVGTMSQLKSEFPPSNFTFNSAIKKNHLAIWSDIANNLENDNVVMLDVRTKDEHQGIMLKNGASSAGRIPGSIHLDWMEFVDSSTGKFKTIKEIETIFAELELDKSKRIVTYCHSGVRSAHTYFVLTALLGVEDVRNFDGSWVEWTYQRLPVETDTILYN